MCPLALWAAGSTGQNPVVIQNDDLAVTISTRGAELQSILHVPTGTEYLWQGDPEFWPDRSPNMFPVNVRFKDERFTYTGREYSMPRMGLAKNADFTVVAEPANPQAVNLVLESNESTLVHYPFPFRLEITSEVNGLWLVQRYTVVNTGTEALFFALGGHPGFRAPLGGARTRADYQYAFPERMTLDRKDIQNSLVTNAHIPFLQEEDRLSLDDARVPGGGMFLLDSPARRIGIAMKGRPPYVTVDLQDFPNVNLWSPPGMPYACIEPMVAHHDLEDTDLAIEKKDYLIELPAGESKSYQYTIIIHPEEGTTALGNAALRPIPQAADRPNIVWLVTEDNSVNYLRLYDPDGAAMPTVERLAEQGLTFNNAFSNAPVCSVARSAIISGCYGPWTFTQFHRRSVLVPLPDGLHMFPWYLRQAGYYTTNNAKEDYNFTKEEGVWDESSAQASYRNRAGEQPFFHVQNFDMTHEGKLHFTQEELERQPTVTDPQTVPVFPIHPDTPLFRHTNARYRDLHMQADREMGRFLDQLESDGLMDNTIVFYYGDNGGVLPGSKGYLYERGLHVPMVVHVPEKWRHLLPVDGKQGVPAGPGSRIDGFVQFIDLGPTVLNLAGIPVPAGMDGKPFLGKGVSLDELNARDTAFSYADRFDEKYDFVRTLRRGKFKYMRSYQPFNVDALQNNYRYKMLAYREWRDLHKAGQLTPAQSAFFEARPAEALYNVETDSFELHNLAGDEAHGDVLMAMRAELQGLVKSMPDLSFIPEPVLHEEAASDPRAYGQAQQDRIRQLADIADLNLLSIAAAEQGIERALAASDPLQRYWGWIVCSSFGGEAAAFADMAREAVQSDPDNLVRMRAAEFLGLAGLEDPRPALIACLRRSASSVEAALVLNSITLLQDTNPGWQFTLERDWLPQEWFAASESNVARRLDYLQGRL